jgi:GT2 family glycosyltransferase
VKVSIVIPNWSGQHWLETCFESLRRQTYKDFEIIMVDNGSTDDSVSFTRQNYPEVKIIELPENLGYAGGVQKGIEASRSDAVVFLNNDTEAPPQWLAELVGSLERHPEAGMATSKMVKRKDKKTLDGAGDILNWYFVPFPRGRDQLDRGQYDVEEEVFSPSGGAGIVRREMLEKVGGIDEHFFAYYEDVDLGFRGQLAGYKCIYNPKALIYHDVWGTSKRDSDFTYYHPMKNRWFLIIKNVPLSLLLIHLHKILIAEAIFWVRAVRKHKVGALLRAYGSVFTSLPRLLRERRRIRSLQVVSNPDLHRLINEKYPPSPKRVLRILQ